MASCVQLCVEYLVQLSRSFADHLLVVYLGILLAVFEADAIPLHELHPIVVVEGHLFLLGRRQLGIEIPFGVPCKNLSRIEHLLCLLLLDEFVELDRLIQLSFCVCFRWLVRTRLENLLFFCFISWRELERELLAEPVSVSFLLGHLYVVLLFEEALDRTACMGGLIDRSVRDVCLSVDDSHLAPWVLVPDLLNRSVASGSHREVVARPLHVAGQVLVSMRQYYGLDIMVWVHPRL